MDESGDFVISFIVYQTTIRNELSVKELSCLETSSEFVFLVESKLIIEFV